MQLGNVNPRIFMKDLNLRRASPRPLALEGASPQTLPFGNSIERQILREALQVDQRCDELGHVIASHFTKWRENYARCKQSNRLLEHENSVLRAQLLEQQRSVEEASHELERTRATAQIASESTSELHRLRQEVLDLKQEIDELRRDSEEIRRERNALEAREKLLSIRCQTFEERCAAQESALGEERARLRREREAIAMQARVADARSCTMIECEHVMRSETRLRHAMLRVVEDESRMRCSLVIEAATSLWTLVDARVADHVESGLLQRELNRAKRVWEADIAAERLERDIRLRRVSDELKRVRDAMDIQQRQWDDERRAWESYVDDELSKFSDAVTDEVRVSSRTVERLKFVHKSLQYQHITERHSPPRGSAPHVFGSPPTAEQHPNITRLHPVPLSTNTSAGSDIATAEPQQPLLRLSSSKLRRIESPLKEGRLRAASLNGEQTIQ